MPFSDIENTYNCATLTISKYLSRLSLSGFACWTLLQNMAFSDIENTYNFTTLMISNYLSRLSLSGFACLSSVDRYTTGTPGLLERSVKITRSPEKQHHWIN